MHLRRFPFLAKTDFINLERLSLKQLEMKGFEESPVILTVIVWYCYNDIML